MEGWISVQRKIRDHWIWKDSEKLKWWLDILLEANHTGKKVVIGYNILECKRGECLVSLQEWGKRWNVSKSVVNNFFALLKKDEMITLKNETITTRLIVCNYGKYQDSQNASETQRYRNSTATVPQQSTTNKANNANNENNDNNNPLNPPKGKDGFEKYLKLIPEIWSPILEDWLEYKKSRRESYKSDKSFLALFDKIKKLSNENTGLANEIVKQSMANNWAGLFELKNNGKSTSNNTTNQRGNNTNGQNTFKSDAEKRRDERKALTELSIAILQQPTPDVDK
jgi:hypothetical protein